MGDRKDDLPGASQFSVEVSSHSHLVFSKLKQYGEVVFWERPEIPPMRQEEGDVDIVLRVSDRIDNIADVAYNDSVLWWMLAYVNEIGLPPLHMQPGGKFLIPNARSATTFIRGER